jgi:hypothetical protein
MSTNRPLGLLPFRYGYPDIRFVDYASDETAGRVGPFLADRRGDG